MESTQLILNEDKRSLAVPLNVVTDETAKLIKGLSAEALAFKVCDAESFEQAAERLNQLGRSRKAVKDAVTERRKPFNEILDSISAMGKELLDEIMPAESALEKEMVAFDQLQNEEARKAEVERQRLAEIARKAEEERQRAEAEKARLQEEARLRQEEAAKLVEAAKTDEEFNAAAEAFDAGTAKTKEADAIPVPVVPAVVAAAPARVFVPFIAKPAGAKPKETIIIESLDVKLLPRTYLMADEAKIKRHILDKTITGETPGLKYRIESGFSGTGKAGRKG